mmetsp:Transcript_67646/g.180842  ORF Transcript_67646/g.180842 Transcript_67646/m.180842 type:complete len:267 (-) Transcript_67646:286-1086(-)
MSSSVGKARRSLSFTHAPLPWKRKRFMWMHSRVGRFSPSTKCVWRMARFTGPSPPLAWWSCEHCSHSTRESPVSSSPASASSMARSSVPCRSTLTLNDFSNTPALTGLRCGHSSDTSWLDTRTRIAALITPACQAPPTSFSRRSSSLSRNSDESFCAVTRKCRPRSRHDSTSGAVSIACRSESIMKRNTRRSCRSSTPCGTGSTLSGRSPVSHTWHDRKPQSLSHVQMEHFHVSSVLTGGAGASGAVRMALRSASSKKRCWTMAFM